MGRLRALGTTLGLGAAVLFALSGGASAAAPAGAHTARSVSVNDTGHLHLLKYSGSVMLEEGPAAGTLPGKARVRMIVGATVSATFTITVHGGSISGSGSAALHSSGRYSSFGGSLRVVRGTGRFRHARGGGKLYGTLDRRTHALVVQTIGTLGY